MSLIPTEEQRAAIECEDRRYSVRAAAGSGKTRVITEKYLRCVLQQGISPDEILTITFTRAAAVEMRSRIVKAIREAGKLEIAQVAETGPILTIHSFCDRILRENALAARIDPEFEVLDDSNASIAKREALQRVILNTLDELPLALEYFQQFAGRRDGRRRGASLERIETRVSNVLGKLRESGIPLADWRDATDSPDAVTRQTYLAIVDALPTEVAAQVVGNRGDLIANMQQAFRGKRPAWFVSPKEETENSAARLSCGLGQLAVAVWHEFEQYMLSRQHFDFAELETRAVHMLETNPDTRQAIAHQYKVMLVDESQDVNPLQYRLMDSLSVAQQMMVGDVQQAIYGFRGASPELFSRRSEQVATLPLSQNFRSEPGVLRFVDGAFGMIWPDYKPMTPPVAPDPDDPFGPETGGVIEGVDWLRFPAASAKKTAEWVETLVKEGEQPGNIAVLVRSMFQATEIRKGLNRLGVPARIVRGSETFYTRLVVRDLANALRALANPHDDFALLATLRGPIAQVSLDTIVLLATEPDVITRLKDFRSPVAEDNERILGFLTWFERLSSFADRLAAWECVSAIFEKTDYLVRVANEVNGPQDVANARKLLQISIEMPHLGPIEFAEHIGEIQSLRHKEGEATALDSGQDEVKILTVHSAKGLEYEVVVLDLTAYPPPPDGVYVDSAHMLIAESTDEVKSIAYQLLKHQKSQASAAEDERLIYVGMTRAKRRLSIVALPPGKGKSLAARLSTWVEPILGRLDGINIVDFNPPRETMPDDLADSHR